MCSKGTCRSNCEAGLEKCGDLCVNTESDPKHCGKCDVGCSEGQSCLKGKCICPSGQKMCGSTCTDTTKNKEHCGACGTACQPNESCKNGACGQYCTSNQTKCAGTCKDLQNDEKNCGVCAKQCASGEMCNAGVCSTPWMRSAGSVLTDSATGIALDGNGNIYVTGVFRRTAFFGKTTLNSKGGYDVFVAKLNTKGEWLWVKSVGTKSDDTSQDIAVDAQKNVYVTGSFRGNIEFDSKALDSKGRQALFVAKINEQGKWIWAQGAFSATVAVGQNIAIHNNGNIYVTGYFMKTTEFGSIKLASKGYEDIFVAKLNAQGKWIWAKGTGSSYRDKGHALAVDKKENIYIAGNFERRVTFGTTTLTSKKGNDSFIAKLNNQGAWLWAIRTDSHNKDLAIHDTENIYVTGSISGTGRFGGVSLVSRGGSDIFVAKLSSQGKWLWAQRAGSTSRDSGLSIAANGNGEIYFTGTFNGTSDFGTKRFVHKGKGDIFIALLDDSGRWLGARQIGSNSLESVKGIAAGKGSAFYIAGSFEHSLKEGKESMTSKGLSDLFVAKLFIP